MGAVRPVRAARAAPSHLFRIGRARKTRAMESLTLNRSVSSGPLAIDRRTLDPEARKRVIRLIIFGSIFCFALAAAKISFAPVLAILFFLFLYLRDRLDPVDSLVVMLAVMPWLGSYRYFGYGFSFDRGFVILALASLASKFGPRNRRFLSNPLDITLWVFLGVCAL